VLSCLCFHVHFSTLPFQHHDNINHISMSTIPFLLSTFTSILVDQSAVISLYHHSNTESHSFYVEKFVLSQLDFFTNCLVRIWELIEQVELQYSNSNGSTTPGFTIA